MRHLFDCWQSIGSEISAAAHVMLFLDFDGTLADIASHPSEAFLPAATRHVLERLTHFDNLNICIISARDHASLRRLMSLTGVRCLGLYGWDDGHSFQLDQATQTALLNCKTDTLNAISGLPNVWLEDKLHSFAVHYRCAEPDAAAKAQAALKELLLPYRDHVRGMHGKKVIEVLPACIPGKGEAVRRELARGAAGSLAIYAGDDTSDEDAFRAVPEAITIHVGHRASSAAHYRLRSPEEVRTFLEKLEAQLSSLPQIHLPLVTSELVQS